jgi:hypothetical protein
MSALALVILTERMKPYRRISHLLLLTNNYTAHGLCELCA